MSDLNRIGQLWLGYREQVLPKNAGSVQLMETRRAFYAGAHALFTELMVMFDPNSEPTSEDVRRLSLVETELKRFNDRVKQGLA